MPEASFEARRVSPQARAPRVVAALAVVGLGMLVVVAGLGAQTTRPGAVTRGAADTPDGGGEPEPRECLASDRPSSAQAGTAAWPPSRRLGVPLAPVRLALPAVDRTITRRVIRVRGTVLVRADTVRVVLESSKLRPIASAVVDTSDPDGGIRRRTAATIDLRFALPSPRPEGQRLWIVITAYDDRGTPIIAMRRAVGVGPLERRAGQT